MVDWTEVGGVLSKGVYGGLGLVASETVGGFFARQQDAPDIAGAAGNVAAGAAIDLLDEDIGQAVGMDGAPELMGVKPTEYFGVGVQAAGWREVAGVFNFDLTSTQEVVNMVEADSGGSNEQTSSSQTQTATVGSY